MGTFEAPLVLEYVDGRDWIVHLTFTYSERDYFITVPAGFCTDFASVPRFFWRILPPTGHYGKAAVVHDFLYRTGYAARRRADAVFFDAMQDLGVNWPTRWVMWSAVRVFGWLAYRSAARARRPKGKR